MKIKSGYMIHEVLEDWVVIPLGERVVEFNSIIKLSSSGALLWKKLESEASLEELLDEIISVYNVDIEEAKTDVIEFIEELKNKGLLENDQ